MKPRKGSFGSALRVLPWATVVVLAVWLVSEVAVSVSTVHDGETCMFDWDAYMEQVDRLMNYDVISQSGTDKSAGSVILGSTQDAVEVSRPTSGWNFNYTELKGDTGPLVYPALHTWIHSALFVVTSWDARRWTTEAIPKNMSGYEERTHRPIELLHRIQYAYTGLHIATLVVVVALMAAAGLLSPIGQVGERGDAIHAGDSATAAAAAPHLADAPTKASRGAQRGSLLQRIAAALLSFLRAQGPAIVTCVLLSVSQRVRNTSVTGLFNDSWAMLLAHACVLAFVHRRFLTGCLLLSAGVAVKMNVLLLAPGVLYVLLAEGGIAFAARHIAACGALQLLLAAPFLVTAPVEYLRRAFDLGRKFDQQWSVNWNFLPAAVFGSGLFAAGLLCLQVALLLAFAARVWRSQHCAPGPVGSETIEDTRFKHTSGSLGTAGRAEGIDGSASGPGDSGALAPSRTPTADPEGPTADDDVAVPLSSATSRLQRLRERQRSGASTPGTAAAAAAAGASASPRDAEHGCDDPLHSRSSSSSSSSNGSSSNGSSSSSSRAPDQPADRGRARLRWPLPLSLSWSWQRGASPPLSAQGA